ncbi:MAG: NAD(P)H-hydrate epimerase, partial [Bacteroidota bacterium]
MLLANAAQIRRADQIMIEQYQFPGILLMETAGRLATERILSLYPEQQSFLLLIGPGNNGGDGLAIARRLHVAGKQVKMIFSHPAERFQGDAQINYEITSRLPISTLLWSSDGAGEWESGFAERPVLIDALLGTGISDRLRGAIAEMIEYLSPLDLPTIAIDLPSGMDANTGFLLNQVLMAEHCLTFQLAKLCHFVTPAANACGQVHVLDIE